jgi:hypothetical protein
MTGNTHPLEKTMSDTITISRKALTSIFRSFIDYYPDPNNPLPPGPWDPVIRKALSQMGWKFRPSPDPWILREYWGDQIALNPQPLPPRLAYITVLAQEVVNSVVNLQDLTETLSGDFQAQIAQVANQRLQLFFDDYCGTPPRKSPFPFPHPREGFIEGFRPLELVIIGTQLESTAATLVNGELQQALSALGTKMIEQGVAQL